MKTGILQIKELATRTQTKVKREDLVSKLKELLGSKVGGGSSGGSGGVSQTPEEMAKKAEETRQLIFQLENRVASLEKELNTKKK